MHPNAAFRWDDHDAMRDFAKDVGFGMLFLTTADGPHVAHLPFVFLGPDRIGFHMARNNAIAPYLDGAEALFVVNGPDGYISPDYYGAADQVPTWNYIAIELVGSVRKMDEAELVAQSDALSDHQEAKLAAKPVWTRAKMTDGLFEKMLRGIYGFEMEIRIWRSTRKLGQNKAEALRLAAADGAASAGNIAIADAMRRYRG